MNNNHFKYLSILFVLLISSSAWADKHSHKLWSIDDLLSDASRPYVIGHRGYGENLGENPDKPIENTLASVRRAFEEGVSIVEVDVSVTADGKAVAIHDDYLSDYTCINSLTYEQLLAREPHIPKLVDVLRVAKKYARKSEHISGLVDIEIKTPAPLCDVNDTTEAALVGAVIAAVEKTRMQDQVIVESFSPAIIGLLATEAAHLKRNLTVSGLQLLSAAEIEAITGLSVSYIDKQVGFGLQWAEIGVLYRLPGYRSIEEYIGAAYQLGTTFLTIDKLILFQIEQMQAGAGALFIQQLHQLGFTVKVYTVDAPAEWGLLSAMGVDGIFTNDITLGL